MARRARVAIHNKAIFTYHLFSAPSPIAYHLNGLLFTTHTSFLLDTGAAVSLLSRALWERVKPDGAEVQPGISRQLVSVDGTPLKICGSAVVPVQLADRTFDINIVVAEGLTTEAILGLDSLEAHLCILDLGRRTQSFDGCNTIPFRAAPTKTTIPLKVSLVESICIPATSELEIMAHVSGLQGSQACLLEQAQYKCLPVPVARALVTPTVGGVPVRLLNPAPHQVTGYNNCHNGACRQSQHLFHSHRINIICIYCFPSC